jgi:hypothetical protein
MLNEELNRIKGIMGLPINENKRRFGCNRFDNDPEKKDLCLTISDLKSWLHKDEDLGMKSIINKKFYINKYLKEGDVLISVNSHPISYEGQIKFDFYPEKIPIDDIGLWFNPGDKISIEFVDIKEKKLKKVEFNLEVCKTNIDDYYMVDPKSIYYIENNSLILSIFCKNHLENLNSLKLSASQIIKIFERTIHQRDLFTIYLSDINYNKIGKFSKYPVGEIILEINDKKFNNLEDFSEITKEPITKIKTIDNEIYFISTNKQIEKQNNPDNYIQINY